MIYRAATRVRLRCRWPVIFGLLAHFVPSMHDIEQSMTRDPLEDLAAAIRDNCLDVFYQPQVTADGQSIAAVESLVRWHHPEVGWIPPSTFVPFAEENGLIEALGSFVLRRACRDAARWPALTVAVNVSPLQFRNPNFLSIVDQALLSNGLSPVRLELEITEGAFFSDPNTAETVMRALRARGIRLALDDFGTGYSSLSYLRQMPWDKVKIDKSFVDDVSYVTSAAIVHSIVALAKAIGLKVTAEGVETAEQHRFLRLAGCNFLQGYLFACPLPADGIDQRLNATPTVRLASAG